MNLHKDIVRNAYHKEKRVPVREQDASYPDGREQVEDGLLRCRRSFLTASLFAFSTEVGQGYEGILWRMANNNSQAKSSKRKTYNGRKPAGADSGNGQNSAREAVGSGCSC